MATVKHICFHKDQDAKLERDISGGVVSLDTPWVKIDRMYKSLGVPVPAMVPPDPRVEIQVKLYWTLDTRHWTLDIIHSVWPLVEGGVSGHCLNFPSGMLPPKHRPILGSLAFSEYFFWLKNEPYHGQITF